jgi:hypothetical protein
MADPTITFINGQGDGSLLVATWNLTTADPTGTAISYPEWADRTWQSGKSGDTLGGSVTSIQGCNTNTDADFSTLSNAAGAAALTFAALQLTKTVIELPLYMRPKLTTPGVGAIVTVILVARRANPMRT